MWSWPCCQSTANPMRSVYNRKQSSSSRSERNGHSPDGSRCLPGRSPPAGGLAARALHGRQGLAGQRSGSPPAGPVFSWANDFQGAKLGANASRLRATPGYVRRLPSQVRARQGDFWLPQATFGFASYAVGRAFESRSGATAWTGGPRGPGSLRRSDGFPLWSKSELGACRVSALVMSGGRCSRRRRGSPGGRCRSRGTAWSAPSARPRRTSWWAGTSPHW
jgi:hypothetical protein